jgi:hypothetical protein
MNVEDYCLPTSNQFPAIDAIAVVAEMPWTSRETSDPATETKNKTT